MDKDDSTCIQWDLAVKRINEILSFAMTCIDLEGNMLSKKSQTTKDK